MAEAAALTCFHCMLPVGRRPLRHRMAGALRSFCCHGCYLVCLVTGRHGERGESLLALARLIVGVTCAMVVMIFSWSSYADRYLLHHAAGEPDALALLVRYYVLLTATVAVAVLGLPIVYNAVADLRNLRAGIAPLIALGAFSAYAVSVAAVARGGETYFDTATMILVFFTLGHFLEARGRAQATEAVRTLSGLVPDTARVLREDGEVVVSAADVEIGNRVLVRSGETIPVDGVVCEGGGGVNEAALTGEGRPVAREKGDRVLAGTVSLDGAFVINVTALAGDRAVARLARLAEEAKRQKPACVGLAEAVASIFTPLVILLAIGTLVFWGPRVGFVPALLIALSVLLIACPCTLGVATPLAFWSGLALAARRGILVRSGVVFERLARASDVFFDKTGTLTQGTFRIVDLLHAGTKATGATDAGAPSPLQIAASLESRAQHPIASALREAAAAAGLADLPLSSWHIDAGLGIRGRIANRDTEYVLGSRRLMERCELAMDGAFGEAATERAARGESVVYLGWAGKVRTAFVAAEEARPEARAAVEALRRLGSRVALLTGDERGSAERLAAAVGIASVRCALLPQDKVDAVQAGRCAVMVGDGINDAAALAAAHVGIALDCGTDVAREMADVTVVGGNLMQVPWLLDFARRIRRTVVTNLIWAFGYNLVGLGLALTGRVSPVFAAMAMVASSLFVFANTQRLSRGEGSEASPRTAESTAQSRPANLRLSRRRPDMARDRWTRGVSIGAWLIVPVLLGIGTVQAQELAGAGELEAGRFIYERSCVTCHGPRGAGDGVAAPLLDPQPRDFTRGLFKFRSTPTGTMPTLGDLERTLTHGLAGTAMNQWSELSRADRRAVLLYIATFSRFGSQEGTPIAVPPEPPFNMESAKRGAQAYELLQCGKCHGPTGRGDGPSAAELKDSWDRPIRTTDLTEGSRYKRGSTPRDIYLTFFTGLMGTPMPSYGGALKTPDEEWGLVHYVYALSQGKQVP